MAYSTSTVVNLETPDAEYSRAMPRSRYCQSCCYDHDTTVMTAQLYHYYYLVLSNHRLIRLRNLGYVGYVV